jgi:hypothetical protein
MFDDSDNKWEHQFENHEENNWDGAGLPPGPSTSLENLRDNALVMFDHYLAFRLKCKPRSLKNFDVESCRKFLSLDETESIIKEFNSGEDLPDGVYAIGAASVEELMVKTKQLLHALMARIMSNLAHEGVKMGLLDCSFDSDSQDFSFMPSKEGEELITRLMAERKTKKKKKKKDDSDD